MISMKMHNAKHNVTVVADTKAEETRLRAWGYEPVQEKPVKATPKADAPKSE